MFIVGSTLPIPAMATGEQAGVRIRRVALNSDILTVAVQMKLPEGSQGVTSFASVLSFDDSKLTLVEYENTSTTVTSDGALNETRVGIDLVTPLTSSVVDVKLTDSAEYIYDAVDATLFSASGNDRTLLTINVLIPLLGLLNDPIPTPGDAQNTTSWQDVYQLSFKVANVATLDPADIRFADATTDSGNFSALDATGSSIARSAAAEFHIESNGTIYTHSVLDGSSTEGKHIMSADGSGTTDLSEQQFLTGDVNGDGVININDVIRLLNHVNTSQPLTDINFGKITDDDIVNINDVIRLLNHVNTSDPLH